MWHSNSTVESWHSNKCNTYKIFKLVMQIFVKLKD